jgi:HAD superfamily hydrolase (TIGR01549 family)
VRRAVGRGPGHRRVPRAGEPDFGGHTARATGVASRPRGPARLIPVFDFDGTLLDSDEALVAPFVALGVPRDRVTFGHVVDEECARLGVSPARYLALYDPSVAEPFAGVDDLVATLDRWGLCSNKHREAGQAELSRLGWTPDVALFSDAFGGGPKRLGPVLDALGAPAASVVFVGDTAHDRACAQAAGCRFALAGWNPRAASEPGDLVLAQPADLLAVLA